MQHKYLMFRSLRNRYRFSALANRNYRFVWTEKRQILAKATLLFLTIELTGELVTSFWFAHAMRLGT